MGALLKGDEVAALAGVTERSVRRNSCAMVSVPSEDPARNGRRPRLYDSDSLSPKLQNKLAADSAAGLVLGLNVADGPNLSVGDQAEADRRYRIIEPLVCPDRFRDYWRENRDRRSAVLDAIAAQHGVNRVTLYRWLDAWNGGGLPSLVRRGRSDAGQLRVMTSAALEFLTAAALPRKGVYGRLTVREIYRAYEEERTWRAAHTDRALGDFERAKYGKYLTADARLRPEAQLPSVSYETFRQWHNRLPSPVRTYAQQGESAFTNTQEILSFRALSEVQPLDYVVLDHRRLDFFCMVREGQRGWKLIRPWLTAAIDMRTRKFLSWVIVEIPSSDSIAVVLKRTFIEHGLPKAIYIDNGVDFTCTWFEGKRLRSDRKGRVGELSDRWRGVLDTLGVRIHHAIVRRARSKIIEPNFRRTAEFDKSLPWYCGHKPTARPERFDELIGQHEAWLKGQAAQPAFPTIERVAELYGAAIKALNERELSGEGMQKILPTGRGWLAPNEAWELLIPSVERRAVPADVLQFAFAKRKVLKVRHGELRMTFAGRQYHYRFIDNSIGLMRLNDCEVELAYDPLDLGTAAVYFENRFVGFVANVELRHMGEEDFAQDERDRRAARRMIRRTVEAVHAAAYVPGPEERLRRQAVLPARIEPQRAEVAASVRPEVAAAAAAKREEDNFSFAAAGAVDVVKLSQNAYRDDDVPGDDEFNFFSGGK